MYGSLAPVLILACASSFQHHKKKPSDQTVHSSVALSKMVSREQKNIYIQVLSTKIALIYIPDLQAIHEIYKNISLRFLRCQ